MPLLLAPYDQCIFPDELMFFCLKAEHKTWDPQQLGRDILHYRQG